MLKTDKKYWLILTKRWPAEGGGDNYETDYKTDEAWDSQENYTTHYHGHSQRKNTVPQHTKTLEKWSV